MACFLVPLAEGIALTAAKPLLKKNGLYTRLGDLQKMLFGGSFLLGVEHVYHGEVVFYPPFLTAMNNPKDTAQMLHEMATVGTAMALCVTLVWAILCLVAKKRASNTQSEETKHRRRAKTILHVALGAAVMFGVDGAFALLS